MLDLEMKMKPFWSNLSSGNTTHTATVLLSSN